MEIDGEACCAYSSCAYWHAKERMSFLTDSWCRYWFNKAGRSFRIGQIYSRVVMKEERSANEPLSLSFSSAHSSRFSDTGADVCHRWDIYRLTYTTWHYCRINSSSTYRRDSIGKYMALMRKCVDDTSINRTSHDARCYNINRAIHIYFAPTVCHIALIALDMIDMWSCNSRTNNYAKN